MLSPLPYKCVKEVPVPMPSAGEHDQEIEGALLQTMSPEPRSTYKANMLASIGAAFAEKYQDSSETTAAVSNEPPGDGITVEQSDQPINDATVQSFIDTPTFDEISEMAFLSTETTTEVATAAENPVAKPATRRSSIVVDADVYAPFDEGSDQVAHPSASDAVTFEVPQDPLVQSRTPASTKKHRRLTHRDVDEISSAVESILYDASCAAEFVTDHPSSDVTSDRDQSPIQAVPAAEVEPTSDAYLQPAQVQSNGTSTATTSLDQAVNDADKNMEAVCRLLKPVTVCLTPVQSQVDE